MPQALAAMRDGDVGMALGSGVDGSNGAGVMFDSLKDKLQDVFGALGKRGALRESDVDTALREVRLALLDADVALPVVKTFISKVLEQAVGTDVRKPSVLTSRLSRSSMMC